MLFYSFHESCMRINVTQMYALVLFYVKYYDLEGQVEDETIMHVDLEVSPRQFPVIPRLVLSS